VVNAAVVIKLAVMTHHVQLVIALGTVKAWIAAAMNARTAYAPMNLLPMVHAVMVANASAEPVHNLPRVRRHQMNAAHASMAELAKNPMA
jgi:hypothetical protein